MNKQLVGRAMSIVLSAAMVFTSVDMNAFAADMAPDAQGAATELGGGCRRQIFPTRQMSMM